MVVLKDHSSSYKVLLEKAKVPTLYVSRIKSIAIETFKCIHKLNPKFLHSLLTIHDTGYGLRDEMKIQPPRVRSTTYGLNSFRYEASIIWNKIPYEIRKVDSLHVFMNSINRWPGPQCSCGNCILCQILLM